MLHYNENKVQAGEAKLLLASGFAGNVQAFSLEQKLKRFEHLTMLNNRVKTNAIHISLNFDEQDKLSAAQLQQIAMDYMERIGFGDLPYLVYQHTDAAHTHIHIATINIKSDGSRIDTHGIGWKLSEPARIAIEKEHCLVQAKGRNRSNQLGIKPADIEKAIYGKSLTKRSITNIVNAVIRDYRFTSLAEFNAILQQFNVIADRGGENTLMREKGGLQYSLIDQKGKKMGIPIKASAIYNKPTLKNLQQEFERNQQKRQPHKEPLKEKIEALFKQYCSITKATFISELQKQNVNVLFRANDKGYTYGVTFIDNNQKAVFNGSDLGKAYSAKGIHDRFSTSDKRRAQVQSKQQQRQPEVRQQRQSYLQPKQSTNYLQLAMSKYQPDVAPAVPHRKKKKKGLDQDQELTL